MIKKKKQKIQILQVAGTELIDESFGSASFLDDSLFIILAERSAEFVIIHGWSVLAHTPKFSNMSRIFNFKNAIFYIDPFDTVIMFICFTQ